MCRQCSFVIFLSFSIVGIWSWGSSLVVSTRGSVCMESRIDPLWATFRRQPTSLSVLGFFQGKDEQGKEDPTDEVVADTLSGVSKVMDSMQRFKTSQRVSDRTNTVIQELASVTVEGSSADGKVKVTYNGQQRPIGVQIDESYFQSLGRKSGARELSVALTEAMKQAHEKSAGKMEDKLKGLYSDLGFPAT